MATQPKHDPNDGLVDVFDTQQESEAMVVHGLLESAGIESIITNLDAPQDVLPGVGGVIVRVNPEQADAARQLIEDYRNTPESDEDTDDDHDSDEDDEGEV